MITKVDEKLLDVSANVLSLLQAADFAAVNALLASPISSWTPELRINNSATGITQTSEGKYSKVGRLVLASGTVLLSSKGASTGDVHIYGLPVPPALFVAGGIFGATISFYSGLASITGDVSCLLANDTSGKMQLWMGGAAGRASLSEANLTNSANLRFSALYLSGS